MARVWHKSYYCLAESLRYVDTLWVYCPGHAGVKGNHRVDTLAGKATLKSGLLLGRSAVLRSLRQTLPAGTVPRTYYTVDRLEEIDVERGSARRSSLKGRERAIVSQSNTGTVSKATLGTFLRRDKVHMGFFECTEILCLRSFLYVGS